MLKFISKFFSFNPTTVIVVGVTALLGIATTWHYVDKAKAVAYSQSLIQKELIIRTRDAQIRNIKKSNETNAKLIKQLNAAKDLAEQSSIQATKRVKEYEKSHQVNDDCTVSDDLTEWMFNFNPSR